MLDRAQILILVTDSQTRALITEGFDGQVPWQLAAYTPESLELVKSQSYDLLVLDSDIPTLGGADLVHQIRVHEPTSQLPIVILSAFPDLWKYNHGLKVQAIVEKPFSGDELARIIEQTLNGATGAASRPEA